MSKDPLANIYRSHLRKIFRSGIDLQKVADTLGSTVEDIEAKARRYKISTKKRYVNPVTTPQEIEAFIHMWEANVSMEDMMIVFPFYKESSMRKVRTKLGLLPRTNETRSKPITLAEYYEIRYQQELAAVAA